MVNTTAAVISLQSQVDDLQTQVNDLNTYADEISGGADEMWHLIAGTLVFFMQAGFAMLEAGSVRSKNAVNILFKNLIDGAISAIVFWTLGYGFAYGETANGFVGTSKFGLASNDFDLGNGSSKLDFHTFFFQWTFAATAATIVSGCVAERCKLEAYFLYSFFIILWIYPVIVHWCWGDGWLSPFADQTNEYLFYGKSSNSFIDFAGSGVVHTVGGVAGLIAAFVLGPRKGRFVNGEVVPMPGHSIPIVVLGTIILWVGWYGFNAGSTLCITGDCSKLASKVAVVTTIAAAFGALTMVACQLLILKTFDLPLVCNALLAGLVAVTGPCAVIEPWAAMIIGISGCLVYMGCSKLLLLLQIDDPLEASAIHGGCGIWGVLAVGIFGNDDNAAFAGYQGSANGNHPFRTGEQFGVQLVGILMILVWTIFWSLLLFYGIDFTIGMRVSEEIEDEGLDSSEHGSKAYAIHENEVDKAKKEEARDSEGVELTPQDNNNDNYQVVAETPEEI
mmetsp:Transcript_114570/g.323935  ORF Transcript_114570/g.323935 Transcript_114570/m.323935 type:complete len:505 (+) Transcript_114570:44-1558(+)